MKKQYIKPTLNSVEFKVEEGYAASSSYIGSITNGIATLLDYDNDRDYRDRNGDSRFTRPTDISGGHNPWNSDGTNSGYWD